MWNVLDDFDDAGEMRLTAQHAIHLRHEDFIEIVVQKVSHHVQSSSWYHSGLRQMIPTPRETANQMPQRL
jgi:alpha-D-ribose 1-methylphosphonate 5-triphosphate diphosphatase PhnM